MRSSDGNAGHHEFGVSAEHLQPTTLDAWTSAAGPYREEFGYQIARSPRFRPRRTAFPSGKTRP